MIKEEEVYKIGKFHRPHGIKGELLFTFTDAIFDKVEGGYLVCSMDGILVPFFIKAYRFRSDTTALIKLEDVDSEEKARLFTNAEVFFPKKFIDEKASPEIVSWNHFTGFRVKDITHGDLGKVTGIDDTTINVLFKIEKDRKEILLPAHEKFILKIDQKKRWLTVQIPEGLLE